MYVHVQILAVVSFMKIEVYTCEDVKNSIQGHTLIYFTLEDDPLPVALKKRDHGAGTMHYVKKKKMKFYVNVLLSYLISLFVFIK